MKCRCGALTCNRFWISHFVEKSTLLVTSSHLTYIWQSNFLVIYIGSLSLGKKRFTTRSIKSINMLGIKNRMDILDVLKAQKQKFPFLQGMRKKGIKFAFWKAS